MFIEKILSLDADSLHKARQELIHIKLIAYKKPLYQVLPLDDLQQEEPYPVKKSRVSNNRADSIGHILKNLMEKTS